MMKYFLIKLFTGVSLMVWYETKYSCLLFSIMTFILYWTAWLCVVIDQDTAGVSKNILYLDVLASYILVNSIFWTLFSFPIHIYNFGVELKCIQFFLLVKIFIPLNNISVMFYKMLYSVKIFTDKFWFSL